MRTTVKVLSDIFNRCSRLKKISLPKISILQHLLNKQWRLWEYSIIRCNLKAASLAKLYHNYLIMPVKHQKQQKDTFLKEKHPTAYRPITLITPWREVHSKFVVKPMVNLQMKHNQYSLTPPKIIPQSPKSTQRYQCVQTSCKQYKIWMVVFWMVH